MASAEEISPEPCGRVQWLPECDECDNPAEHYCQTCREKLCTACKTDHLSKQKKRHHKVILYSAENNPEPNLEPCSKHPEQRYELFCELCGTPACITCIVEYHNGTNHSFKKIREIYDTCKVDATARIEMLRSEIKPVLETAIEDTKSFVEKTKQKMKSSHQCMQQYIDEILEENMTQLDNTFGEQLLSYQEKIAATDATIQEYINHLYSDTPVKLITFMRNTNKDREIDSLRTVQKKSLVFEVGHISKEELRRQFGQLKLSVADTCNKGETDADNPSQKDAKTELLDQPVLIKKFTTQCGTSSKLSKITCEGKDLAWIHGGSAGKETKIQQIDRNGHVIRNEMTVLAMYNSTELVVNKDGDFLVSDKDNDCVKKISRDFNTTVDFMTCSTEPKGMCVLLGGNVVICMSREGLLKVYDSKGKMLKEIGSGFLSKPYYVAVNKTNNDLCVSDNDTRVVVMKSNGEYRFTYEGKAIKQKFSPRNLCTDRMGHILVTDYMNDCVHILDKDGKFLQYLVSGKNRIVRPWCIDVDAEGYAWVGELNSRNVLIYKYLK